MWPPDPDLDLVHAAGFMYLPLWFDPSVAQEIGLPEHVAPEPSHPSTDAAPPLVLVLQGRHFIRSVRLQSLIDAYPRLFESDHERFREAFWRRRGFPQPPTGLVLSPRLKTIIFEILPHFIKTKIAGQPGRASPGQLMERLQETWGGVPEGKAVGNRTAAGAAALDLLRREISNQEGEGLPEGRIGAGRFREWLAKALTSGLAARELQRLTQEGRDQAATLAAAGGRLEMLQHLAESGSGEIDGCGWQRRGTDDYLIYKRTGPYALRDFYGRVYLFPDCRVAVSSAGPLHPVVWEKYKHPLLLRDAKRQRICIKDFQAPEQFSVAGVIAALEQGLNAIYYGYNYRKRNGYNSLDQLRQDVGGIHFDDYRVPKDHPLIASGQVEVTNDFI